MWPKNLNPSTTSSYKNEMTVIAQDADGVVDQLMVESIQRTKPPAIKNKAQCEAEVKKCFNKEKQPLDVQNRALIDTEEMDIEQMEIHQQLINVEQNKVVYIEPSIDKEMPFPPIDIESPLEGLDKVPLTSECPWLNVEDPAACLNDVNLENIELYLECSDDVDNSEICTIGSSDDGQIIDPKSTSMIKSDVQLRISFPDFKDDKDKGFRCCLCKKSFLLESSLRDHLNIEHSNQAFVCQFCMYNTKSRKFFQKHMTAKHKHLMQNKDIVSIDSSLKTSSEEMVTLYLLAAKENTLHTHLTKDPTIGTFDKCSPGFHNSNGVNDVKGHLLSSCHEIVTVIDKDYTVPPKFRTSGLIKSHSSDYSNNSCELDDGRPKELSSESDKSETFPCNQCGFITKAARLLTAHQNTMHNRDRDTYTCTQCDFHCLQKRTFDRHKQLHTGVYQFMCPICRKQLLSKSNYTRHIKTHNAVRTYACDIDLCKWRFKTKGGLTDHKKKVHGKSNLKAQGSQSITEASSIKTKQLPSGENRTRKLAILVKSERDSSDCSIKINDEGSPHYGSNFCETDGAFELEASEVDGCRTKCTQTVIKQKGDRGVETRTKITNCDEKVKKFLCSFKGCFKRFRDNFNLKKHLCIHTGTKILTCDRCKFTCVQKASLNHHYRTKHYLTINIDQ